MLQTAAPHRYRWIVLALLLAAAPAQAQNGPERFLRWAVTDAQHGLRSTDSRVALYALGAVTLLAPATVIDEPSGHEVREHYRGPFASYLDLTNELGGPRMTVPVVLAFAASLATPDRKLQDAAFTSLQAVVYTGVMSYAVKYAVGRARPETGEGPWRFEPFSGSTSFPSGHTATAFAALTPWAFYYPHPATYALVAAGAGGTALARIARSRHWATDVVAGAALGTFTAYQLARRHGATPRATLTPVLASGEPGFVLQVNL